MSLPLPSELQDLLEIWVEQDGDITLPQLTSKHLSARVKKIRDGWFNHPMPVTRKTRLYRRNFCQTQPNASAGSMPTRKTP